MVSVAPPSPPLVLSAAANVALEPSPSRALGSRAVVSAPPQPSFEQVGSIVPWAGSVLCAGAAALAAARRTRRSNGVPQHGSRVAVKAAPAAEPFAVAVEEDKKDADMEEWLLGVELPEPLRPFLGSQVWGSFSAAIGQIFLIAVLSAVGTWLPQGGPASYYAGEYPQLSGLILFFGFDHMYSSWSFYGILAWLTASLVACSGTTQIPLAKKSQRIQLRGYASLPTAGAFTMKVSSAANDAAEGEQEDADPVAAARLCNLQAALEKRGFVVRTDNAEAPSKLVAQRGLLSRFAPLVVHLGMVVTIFGAGLGLLIGSSSEVIIPDGGDANLGEILARGRRLQGPLAALNPVRGLMDESQLKVNDFRITYRESNEVLQFYSDLIVQDKKTGNAVTQKEIFVNEPLRYGGATIYQADWAISRVQLFVNDVPILVPLKELPKKEDVAKSWAGILPGEIVEAKDPRTASGSLDRTKAYVVIVQNMRNVQVFGPDGSLVGVLRAPNMPVDRNMEGMPIQFGESIQAPTGSTIRLDRILGSTGLIVKSDPGVPFVYLGFALLMPATLISVLPFAQLWAAVGKGEEAGQLKITAQANRNQPAFEDEVKTMVVSGVL
eukprot:TRINITY_DN74899_c0_g1_i1.p1 TRINITY_DN74899_c0_g1~~TRINITY_DN74899_c0_g1_i1.p1  ORF type:complete len:608 (-),score=122.85 TRINITY_DN74899_c0_g1_i1:61-1884(-)